MKPYSCLIGALLLFLAGMDASQAGTKNWNAATTGDWFTIGNWAEGAYPTNGDAVVITNAGASVLLTNSTAYLGSITLSAPGLSTNTLVFSNWNTTLSATNVYVRTNATVTLPSAFTNNQMSNNVYIVCSNLTIDSGGSIAVDRKGYDGGANAAGYGYGPGAGSNTTIGSGAGYGGYGGDGWSYGGEPYGSTNQPTSPGSGGGSGGGNLPSGKGGAGGGAVRIQADGAVVVNGTISANGTDGFDRGGGGSGGSIYIVCRTFDGTGGVVRASGGHASPTENRTGDGGGGRIAVFYNVAVQTAVPGVCFQSSGSYSINPGDMGTLCFTNGQLIKDPLTNWSGQICGFSSLALDRLTVSNSTIRFPEEGFRLVVTNQLVVAGLSNALELGGFQHVRYAVRTLFGGTSAPVMSVGSLLLTNGAGLRVYACMTNPATTNYGALVSVTGDVCVASNSFIYVQSHPTNGGSVYFRTRKLTLDAGAWIDANGRGYAGNTNSYGSGFGPGRGTATSTYGGGGAYGGFGGNSSASVQSAMPCGSADVPSDPGSGGSGGAGTGGAGGGLIRIEAGDAVTVNGTIRANGNDGSSGGNGGGAGGGVYVACTIIAGSGLVTANGGKSGATGAVGSGDGGGGRISMRYDTAAQGAAPVPAIRFSAIPGGANATHPGDLGTLYFPNTRLLSETNLPSGQLIIPGFASWTPPSLIVSNTMIRFAADGFSLTVPARVEVNGAASSLELGGGLVRHFKYATLYTGTSAPVLNVTGDLVLTNGGALKIYSAPAGVEGYGALVNISGALVVATNSSVVPQSYPTNRGSVFFRVGSLRLDVGGIINADSRGYAGGALGNYDGYGPGYGIKTGDYGTGAGYGGFGGGSYTYTLPAHLHGGATYGSSNAPVEAGSGGSGGSSGNGGAGGGLVWITANNTVTVNGAITGDGDKGEGSGGSGSGGGIYITCRKFVGSSTGLLSADGGTNSSHSSGGGGGRIAVWRVVDSNPGTISATVTNGSGYTNLNANTWAISYPGTVVWGQLPPPGTVFTVH